jgi:transcriptional repressor NrdR
MKCRQCRHPETKVLESRESKDGLTIRRRRECQHCQARFTTFERQEEQPLQVVKRDGSRELFNREKILRSLSMACQKRKVHLRDLEAVVEWVERTIAQTDEKEMTSTAIGELVLEALKVLDSVAYVRFASVYRAFSDVEDFADELKRLSQGKSNNELPEELARAQRR